MKILVLSLLVFFSQSIWAYKIAIYTDEPGAKKAQEIKTFIMSTYPFNQFDLDFVIEPIEASRLNCQSQLGIARNIGCNTEDIAVEASKKGLDQVLVVKDSKSFGGSGGSIPVITSSTPPSIMLHEYMHALGFCDEYEYEASESVHYCKVSGVNMAIIEPNPAGYGSDQGARSEHARDIPWFSAIKDHVNITHDGGTKLGTGTVNSKIYAGANQTNKELQLTTPIALYEGKTCTKASPPKKTWQPGGEATIMEFGEAGLGSGNEVMVMKVLDAKGVPRKNPPSTDVPVSVNSTELRMSKELSSFPGEAKPVQNSER